MPGPREKPLPASALRTDDPDEAEIRRVIAMENEEMAKLAAEEDRAELLIAQGGRAEDRLERDLTRIESTENRGRYDDEGWVS